LLLEELSLEEELSDDDDDDNDDEDESSLLSSVCRAGLFEASMEAVAWMFAVPVGGSQSRDNGEAAAPTKPVVAEIASTAAAFVSVAAGAWRLTRGDRVPTIGFAAGGGTSSSSEEAFASGWSSLSFSMSSLLELLAV
jgi:hypothetical protein